MKLVDFIKISVHCLEAISLVILSLILSIMYQSHV